MITKFAMMDRLESDAGDNVDLAEEIWILMRALVEDVSQSKVMLL
jgi:hypothetical protein